MAKNERTKRLARIAVLRRECQLLSNERTELETINEREDAAPWIGKCFKYLNRDSNGKTWWLYLRVVSHEFSNCFNTLQCQSQTGGWRIATTADHVYLLPDPKTRGYVPISRRQFDEAWNKFTREVHGLNSDRALPDRKEP